MDRFTMILSVTLISILFPATKQQSCTYYESDVSVSEQNQIVNIHNDIRNQIMNGTVPGQPKGKNLQMLQWDSCLASEAQRLANLCLFEHSKAYCSQWEWVGQNIYRSGSSVDVIGANWTRAIGAWFKENQVYTFGPNVSETTGHYTQLVWGDTNRVGCGYLNYRGKGRSKYQKLYFCNYGPGGNYDTNPYETA